MDEQLDAVRPTPGDRSGRISDASGPMSLNNDSWPAAATRLSLGSRLCCLLSLLVSLPLLALLLFLPAFFHRVAPWRARKGTRSQ
jgi:hypothetical protein